MHLRFHFILFVLLALASCNSKPQQPGSETAIKTEKQKKGKLIVHKRSLYSPLYLEKLNEAVSSGNEVIELDSNKVISPGHETTTFPADLELNRRYVFNGKDENGTYQLSLIRTSLTDVTYSLKKQSDSLGGGGADGSAILTPMFFLGSEILEDDKGGTSFGAYQYTNEAGDETVSVYVGIGKDDKGRLRVKAYMYYNKGNDAHNQIETPLMRGPA